MLLLFNYSVECYIVLLCNKFSKLWVYRLRLFYSWYINTDIIKPLDLLQGFNGVLPKDSIISGILRSTPDLSVTVYWDLLPIGQSGGFKYQQFHILCICSLVYSAHCINMPQIWFGTLRAVIIKSFWKLWKLARLFKNQSRANKPEFKKWSMANFTFLRMLYFWLNY